MVGSCVAIIFSTINFLMVLRLAFTTLHLVAKYMQAHLDPSIIIDTPYPLKQLCRFVALSLSWNLFLALACRMQLSSHRLQKDAEGSQLGTFHVALIIALSTIVIHCIYILCGVHPTMCPVHTLISAFYLAFNTLLPVLLFTPASYTPQQQYPCSSFMEELALNMKNVSNYLFGPVSLTEPQKKQPIHNQLQKDKCSIQCMHQYALLGTASGMVACAILRILDHGMQTQRYPMPILIGATFGRFAGTLMGALISVIRPL